MVNPKLLALDLDETTLDRQGRLPPENRRALEAAIARGIHVVVATGRAMASISEEMREFPGIEYAIGGNGATLFRLKTGEILRHCMLPEEIPAQVLELSRGENLTYEAVVDGTAHGQQDYIDDPTRYMADARTAAYVQSTRRPVPDIQAFIRAHRGELESMDLVLGDLATKQRMQEKLKTLDGVYITSSVPRLLEISHQNSGKHRALRWLAEYLNIAPGECAAFGNGNNDAEMLRWAGTGVAVKNATEICLGAADYVTADHDDAGVAKALKTLWGIG